MKDSIKIKVLLFGIVFILLAACTAVGQSFDTNLYKTKTQLKQLDKETIKLDLSILVNEKEVKDTLYKLTVNDKSNNFKSTINVSNKFIVYLNYNTEYEITLTYSNCSTKTILINTYAPEDNWYLIATILLNSNNKEKLVAGGIRYNNISKTFERYKVSQ